MLWWGAIWGAVVGLLVDGWDGAAALWGAALGWLAGHTLRGAVRVEMQRVLETAKSAHADAARQSLAAAPASAPVEPKPQEPAVEPDAAPWALEQGPQDVQRAVPTPPSVHAVPDGVTATPAASPVVAPAQPDTIWSGARRWLLGGNTIVRVGVLVLFVGLAFLAKYAVENAMLPPELRLAAVAAAGLGLFVVGWRLRDGARSGYALTLQGAGTAVLYLTVFAAFRLYQLFPPALALATLTLLCALSTWIALLQNTMPMAFIGFAGAFAAPLLVSTGQGDPVSLFGYYLVLGIAILVLAWWRAWRALNLLGFVATFGVATVWGVLRYTPEQLPSIEPFLIAFFGLYLVAALLYATRHGLPARRAVDATLIFGNPLVAMGLQVRLVQQVEFGAAFSALALGALYLGLAWWALRRVCGSTGRWLAECFAALGLGLVTLAVPLALDGQWTAAVWAAEGAAMYWMGQRQGRALARLAAMALQALAALSYWPELRTSAQSLWPLVNPNFLGAMLLGASALGIAWWSRRDLSPRVLGEPVSAQVEEGPPDAVGALPNGLQRAQIAFCRWEHRLSPLWFWIGFLWLQVGCWHEVERLTGEGAVHALRLHLHMLSWVGMAWCVHGLARAQQAFSWTVAASPAWWSVPIMLGFVLAGVAQLEHLFQGWGWALWPVALALHARTLWGVDTLPPQRVWSWVHSGGVWLVVLLLANLLWWMVVYAQLRGTAWASVIMLCAATSVLLALSQKALLQAQGPWRQCWPLRDFAAAYIWRAAVLLAWVVVLFALLVAVRSDGNARPLPYVPILNPTDLAVALALLVCPLWRVRLLGCDVITSPLLGRRVWVVLWGVVVFIAINTVWWRLAHHWADVPWQASRLAESALVQTGTSLLWTTLALGLMLLAHRRRVRPWWMGGAALLALTVLKLFLVDLSNRGGSERIVAFIGVGVLMLVVGYFAPLPPAARPDSDRGAPESAP